MGLGTWRSKVRLCSVFAFGCNPLEVFVREGRIHVQCCSLDGLAVVESRLLDDLRGFTQPCKA